MTKIRKATPCDLPQIRALIDDIFENEQDIPKALNDIAPSQHPEWWCVDAGGKIVGAAALFQENQDWHLGRIAITPMLRGQHMGTRLLKTILADAFSRNIPAVYLSARDTTVHILKHFGVEILGKPVPFYRGHVTPIVLRRESFLRAVQE